jgi:RND family efflux transporter MFP subunit
MRTFHALHLLALSAGLLTACGGHPEAQLPVAELPVVRARTVEVLAADVPAEVEVRGVVEAEKSVAVSSRVSAMVTGVLVRAGERVGRGQALIEIDPATARGQVAQATGALAQAEAALALASRNFERFEALAATDAASELELDMARMQYEQARGAVEQASGALQAARSVASESLVTAPFAGFVVRRMVDVGDLAAPGRPLLMLESESGRRLNLAVPETLAARGSLDVGSTLRVALDSRPDLGSFEAPIVERSSAADPVSHSFDVKVELPAAAIASGTAGRAWVETAARPAVLAPRSALHRVGGMTMVVTLGVDGRSESRVVTVGGEVGDDRAEILSGLSGEEVLLVGLETVPRNGSPVEVEP